MNKVLAVLITALILVSAIFFKQWRVSVEDLAARDAAYNQLREEYDAVAQTLRTINEEATRLAEVQAMQVLELAEYQRAIARLKDENAEFRSILGCTLPGECFIGLRGYTEGLSGK